MRLNLLLPGLLLLTGCVSKLDDLGSRTQPVHDAAHTPDGGDGEAGALDTCANATLDEGETAIDCGGDKCRPCGLGLPCGDDDDCNSELCSGNVCRSATCRNDELDGDETDKDCGGSCLPCADGLHCSVGAHCQSRVCTASGFCETAKCTDTVKNGEETSEDCGGGTCDKCSNGASCEIARDCMSDFCVESADKTERTCASPDCGDDTLNGSETDEDCGGTCPGCAPGLRCNVDKDCLSLVCTMSVDGVGLCEPPTCGDETQNQGEAAPDCGGPCKGCPADTPCSKPEDCADLVCKALVTDASPTCAAATCGDSVKNGDESDVDCGSLCPYRCEVDDSCTAHADCETNSCGMAAECADASCVPTCQAASCMDSRKNGDETAVDCGGSCGTCAVGAECTDNSDCTSGRCNDDICQPGGLGSACGVPADCASGRCSEAALCERGHAGDGCSLDEDCASDICSGEHLCDPGSVGRECEDDGDCLSDHCDGTCRTGGAGTQCRGPEDCLTAACTDNVCAPEAIVVKTSGDKGTDGRLFFFAKITTPKAIAWSDLALLYSFSETTDAVFDSYSYQSPGGVTAATGLLLELEANAWMLVWRSTSTSLSMAGGEASIDYQLAMRGENFENRRDDYSYLAGADTTNPKVVVCQRDGTRFKRLVGTAPSFIIGDPCAQVVESCGELSNCKEPVRNY
jgi:hypothetical protein